MLVDGAIGAAIGIGLGAIVGVGRKEGRLPALIRDATAKGQSVLVVQTHTEQDTSMVRARLTETDTEVEEFMTTSNEIDAIQNKVR